MMKTIEGVSGALIHNGRVLVVRRSVDDDFLAGYFELPGGRVETGEAKEQAVVRELFEELSLRVEVVQNYHQFSYQLGPNTKCIDYQYLVKIVDGESIDSLKLSPEHDKYIWVKKGGIDTAQPITPEMKNSIEAALNL